MIDVSDFLQGGQAFLEGIALIASPCILPVLPIMLAGSLDGGKKRPFGIITGFVISFVGFALLSRQLLIVLHADPAIVRNVALVLLAVLGLCMLSKRLSDKLFGATQGLADWGANITARWDNKQGYWGGVAIGALVGLIWAPCAGPVMAAAVVQIIQAKSGFGVALTVIMFAVGAGVPMLIIALMGRQVMSKLSFLKTHSNAVRRTLGVVILLSAVLIYEGADVKLLAAVGDNTPTMTDVAAKALPVQHSLLMGLDNPYPAPEFVGTQAWVNSEPLKIADLRGKVVLIDFWTYSCINCVRTLPHLTSWYGKYHDKGFEIVGIHAPEFEFEKKLENVQDAVKRFGIRYPVVQDNDLATWAAYRNKYWPAHYLIDKEGRVVYTHFGEGEYDQTEGNIRFLLGLGDIAEKPAEDNFHLYAPQQTQETYLGYARAANFAGEGGQVRDEDSVYRLPVTLKQNEWALEGPWRVGAQNITTAFVAQKKSVTRRLRLNFFARKVFLVLGTENGKPLHAHVMLNGNPANAVDVKSGALMIDGERLYELIDQGTSQNGILDITFDDPGIQAYAFTFGG